MEPKEENQSENSSVAEAPAAAPAETKVTQAPHKKSFWAKVLPWVIVALVFFIGGVATFYFVLYQPKIQAAQATEADQKTQITDLTSQLDQANTDKSAVQTQLDTANATLSTAQATISEQTLELAKANQMKLVYKLLVDVNAARAALEKLDTNTALQAINFAKDDLKALQSTDIDPASLSGFADRLDTAASKITEPDLLQSRDALDTLYSNLLLLVDQLH